MIFIIFFHMNWEYGVNYGIFERPAVKWEGNTAVTGAVQAADRCTDIRDFLS